MLIYAATFFGIVLGISLIILLATGEFPKGIPLIIIWVVALGALFFVGHRRLYGSSDEPDIVESEPDQDEEQ